MHQYQIGKLIGTGSFGEVFCCKNLLDNQFYVAKKLCLAQLDDKGKENIQNQLKILQTFRHPNIVAFKQSFINEKGLYIIMTYCQGGDLYNRIRKIRDKGKILQESQILNWLVQMALAIYYLHANRILHRDLKSQNIFLELTDDDQENIRLGDFGIAKVMDQKQDLTATTAIGSPYYMAPEIFNRNIYSYKSDIWALGCILYELCNLRTPFDAQSRHGLMMKVMKGSYPSITPSYSKQFRDLIMQMLQKKPSHRPTILNILNKPFIKYRVQNFIMNRIRKANKPEIHALSRILIQNQSLKKQAKLLQIQIQNNRMLTKNSSISSLADDMFLSSTLQKQREGFIDHKKHLMTGSGFSQRQIPKMSKKKKPIVLDALQEQKYNIDVFKMVEDYSMEEQEAEIEEQLGQIKQQQDQGVLDNLQNSYQISFQFQDREDNANSISKTQLKLYNQISVLRNTCQNAIGMHRYVRACQLVQRGAKKAEMLEVLGQIGIGYWHLIEQSMFYQSLLKRGKEQQK